MNYLNIQYALKILSGAPRIHITHVKNALQFIKSQKPRFENMFEIFDYHYNLCIPKTRYLISNMLQIY